MPGSLPPPRRPGAGHPDRGVGGIAVARPRPTLRGALWLATALSLPVGLSLWLLEGAIRLMVPG